MNQQKNVFCKTPTLFNIKSISNAKSTTQETPASSLTKVKHTILPGKKLRRSRSACDLVTRNILIVKPTILPTITATRKPIKRPGTTLTTTKLTASSIIKKAKTLSVQCQNQNVPPKTRPKAAPYDYKTKFNYVKEDYEKLKVSHRDLKEKYLSFADTNEDLISKSDKLENDLQEIQIKYRNIKDQMDQLTKENTQLQKSNETLIIHSQRLEENLQETTKNYAAADEELRSLKTAYSDVNKQFQIETVHLKETLELNETMKNQLIDFERRQRQMHNTIQDLKGNIRVYCRIRPALSTEKHKISCGIHFVDENSIVLQNYKDNKKSEFSFDKVFGPNSVQTDVFLELSELVQSSLDGYNVCIFAYGQTGSGKTYTMNGERHPIDSLGMIPRSIERIFKVIDDLLQLGWTYTIKASFLEIYNETIIDLLKPGTHQLDIRMLDSKSNDIYVTNLTIKTVTDSQELIYLFSIAQKNRAVAATESNDRSSRSHSVTKIIIEGFNNDRNERCFGSLNLVDLAGSEKFSTNEINRFTETKNINKSLSNLNNVILALVKKSSHVPYRNSKLTHLLMPSLGGNSKTLMMVNVNPFEECYGESVNSLRFASTVNQCKTGTIKKTKIIQPSTDFTK